jgi:AraC family transcriptional regulator, regulatory protein of adaptative response / DNA-3-methyladenine glycosylase II
MTDAQMYARLLAGDEAYNGRFFTGVLTTGIYCLPSCKARKPKPENVRFFPSCEAARSAGLRACKKCHPDDFARGADPVLETMETLVLEVRGSPGKFPDVRSVVRRSGFGSSRVFELLRQHYQSTPADLLLRARIDAAKSYLLTTETSVAQIAGTVGFESLSAFHENFRRLNGLTPAAYRALKTSRSFEVALPENYPLACFRRALGRDPQSVTERIDGEHYRAAVRLGPAHEPAILRLTLGADTIRVAVEADTTNASCSVEAHAIAVGLVGLDQDAAAFARLARRLGCARLITGRHELRLSQTPSIYDGLLWAIIGQQINLRFAFTLRRKLVELTGSPLADGLHAPPTPAAVAALKPKDLLPLQFSRQKAEYVVHVSRLIVSGQLDLEALRKRSATRAERMLLAIRGLGPWSVNYLMMRSLGFADCVPYGDTGVTSGLQKLFQLEERPDIDATRRLMAVFSPHRSLATAHLWQLNQPPP